MGKRGAAAIIEVEGLTKDFRIPKKFEGFGGALRSLFSLQYETRRAVDAVSFRIAPGELVGYIGVNGAGKSTTIKMLSGILVPTAGACRVAGSVPWQERMKNASNIGVVFGQRTQLWWDLPVSESYGILQRIYEIPEKVYRDNLAYFRKLLDLDEFWLTPVRSLSLGQKMRADLCASLLHDPQVVYLDEPTIGLDILVKDRIRQAVRHINHRKRTTVILTTHDLDDIEEICERILVIDRGRLIFDGAIGELKRRYGRLREVRFQTLPGKRPRLPDLARAFRAAREDFLLESADGELLVRFNPEKVPVADLIARVVRAVQVRDIVLEEIGMDEVVKRIYREASGKRRP